VALLALLVGGVQAPLGVANHNMAAFRLPRVPGLLQILRSCVGTSEYLPEGTYTYSHGYTRA
jgi:hypothetical protein